MDGPIRCELGDDGTAVLTVLGEIDYSNADEVADGIRDAVSHACVCVDLRGATFVDSTGLGALIEGYRATAAAGNRFEVVNPSPAFRRVLAVTGLCELFGLPEETDADHRAEDLVAEQDQVG